MDSQCARSKGYLEILRLLPYPKGPDLSKDEELRILELTAFICVQEGITDREATQIVHAGLIDLVQRRIRLRQAGDRKSRLAELLRLEDAA